MASLSPGSVKKISQRKKKLLWVRVAKRAIDSVSSSPPSSSSSSYSPPYPSAARISDSPCFPQYTASLKCLETNQEKRKCQQQFDDYKECKKKERLARLERNRNRSLFG